MKTKVWLNLDPQKVDVSYLYKKFDEIGCDFEAEAIPDNNSGEAFGAIGTPPPSAGRFMAAAKIIFGRINPPYSVITFAFAVSIVKSDWTVNARYVSFPR